MVDWDILNEEWLEMGDWIKTGIGTSEINPVGQLHQDTTFVVMREQTLAGGIPLKYVAEMYFVVDSFDDPQAETRWEIMNGTTYLNARIFETLFMFQKAGGSWHEVAIDTIEGVWYTWRFVLDSVGDMLQVYRDDIPIVTIVGLYDWTSGAGLVRVTDIKGEHHVDYWRIGTLIYPLPLLKTTISEKGMKGVLRVK